MKLRVITVTWMNNFFPHHISFLGHRQTLFHLHYPFIFPPFLYDTVCIKKRQRSHPYSRVYKQNKLKNLRICNSPIFFDDSPSFVQLFLSLRSLRQLNILFGSDAKIFDWTISVFWRTERFRLLHKIIVRYRMVEEKTTTTPVPHPNSTILDHCTRSNAWTCKQLCVKEI